MDFFRTLWLIPVSLGLLLLASCTGADPIPTAALPPLKLNAYLTETPSTKPSPNVTAASTLQPTPDIPTPTPAVYAVKKGDTLLEIARRFGISLAELQAANPGVRPEALSVGQTLQIPAARQPEALPTPAAVELGIPVCYPSGGGLYCFAPLGYSGPGCLEDLKVQVSLFDTSGQLLASQEALPPLTGLRSGAVLPALAFFPDLAEFGSAQAQVMTAIQTAGERYLPAEIKNLLVSIAWGGYSAQAQGLLRLPGDSQPASRIWLAGVAYDENDEIVGVRRWEWSGTLAPGDALPFSLEIYSAGPPIARVETLAEAVP